jgi:hypothetical protein
LPEWVLHLPEYKLRSFLQGHFLGDGNSDGYRDKRGYRNHKQRTYTTSSEAFAWQLQRIMLQLGEPPHVWRQADHQGCGQRPIWRVSQNSHSHFAKDFGYPEMSEVSIRSVEPIGHYQTYDWEVQDTHNYFFANGICSHNCDDGANLMASMILMILPAKEYWRVRPTAGDVDDGTVRGGHLYVTFFRFQDNEPVTLDWCFHQDWNVPIAQKPIQRDVKMYQRAWFSYTFNHAHSHTKVIELRGKTKDDRFMKGLEHRAA